MHKASHVDERQDDAKQDQKGRGEVGQQDHRRDEDAHDGQGDVPVQLYGYDFVRLPRRIAHGQGEHAASCQVGLFDDGLTKLNGCGSGL